MRSDDFETSKLRNKQFGLKYLIVSSIMSSPSGGAAGAGPRSFVFRGNRRSRRLVAAGAVDLAVVRRHHF